MDEEITIKKRKIKLTNVEKELDKGIVKRDLIDYYIKISDLMLKHLKDRLISMRRFPDGVKGEKFFQKDFPQYFPKWMSCKEIQHKSKKTCYTIVKDESGIVYLANQVIESHVMTSKKDNVDIPDKIIFDLDPMVKDTGVLRDIAKKLKSFLESIGLEPFIMTTGGKGYHISAPIKRELNNSEVRDFALKITKILEEEDNNITTEFFKSKRGKKIFIDINRNSSMQTSITPFSVRAYPGLTLAIPFSWNKLEKIEPSHFSLKDKNYPKTDAWKDFYKKPVSLKKVIDNLRD